MRRVEVILSVFLIGMVSSSLCWGVSADEGKHFITLHGDFLSVDAQEISPENILKDLEEVCGMRIRTNDNAFSRSKVSLKFSNVPLEEAVKRILKVTGAKNYLISYREFPFSVVCYFFPVIKII